MPILQSTTAHDSCANQRAARYNHSLIKTIFFPVRSNTV